MRYRRSSIARFAIATLLAFIFTIQTNILLPFATLQARGQDVPRYKSHDTTKLIAQTANNQKPEVKEGAVSGSFVDYDQKTLYAERMNGTGLEFEFD
jgi:hypothetical protein